MKKLLKPLIALLFFCSIGSVVLGYMVFEQRKEIKKRTINLEASSKMLAQNLEYPEENLAKLNVNIQNVDRMKGVLKHLETHAAIKQQEIHNLTGDLHAETDLRKLRESELTATRTELGENKQEIVRLEEVVQIKNREIAGLEKKTETLQDEMAGKEVEINLLNGEIAARNDQIGDLMDKVALLEKENQDMYNDFVKGGRVIIDEGVVGTIALVNAKWGYVVLDIGSKAGLKPNATAIVHRDEEFVGKVLITSVEDTTAVAQVNADWQQLGIQVGDSIFFN